ncbi:hypothetical protein U1Q18_003943 [Sarracenia purpurea var. burkii]
MEALSIDVACIFDLLKWANDVGWTGKGCSLVFGCCWFLLRAAPRHRSFGCDEFGLAAMVEEVGGDNGPMDPMRSGCWCWLKHLPVVVNRLGDLAEFDYDPMLISSWETLFRWRIVKDCGLGLCFGDR